MRLKLTNTLHSFLIGLFSILFIYAHNIYYLEFYQLILPVAIVIGLTFIALKTLNLLYKSFIKSALFLSIFWLSFFCYGAIHSFILDKFTGSAVAHHSIILGTVLILLFSWALLLYFANVSPKIVKLANFFALVLVAVPVFNIIRYTASEASFATPTHSTATNLYQQTLPDSSNLPDIVYLILDGYGREDKLRENYDFDNSSFVTALEQQGFQVANKSFSNYCRTAVSVASALNLDYIQSIEGYSADQSYETLDKLGEESVLVHFLKKKGYNLFSFKAGFNVADLSKHARLLTKEEGIFSDLSTMIFASTPLYIVKENTFLYQKYNAVASIISEQTGHHIKAQEALRYRSLYPLDSIPEYIGKPTPSFVLANIYVGHPPFIFDGAGNFTPPSTYGAIGDGDTFMAKSKNRLQLYKEGLKGQTAFLNGRVLNVITKIRSNTTRPTIVILQGDHGPGALYHQTELAKTNVEDRFSILNAVYLPEEYSLELPEDLTPVNTWRYIVNNAFNTNLPILPNRHFYSGLHTPSKFIEVTDQLNSTPHKTPASRVYSRLSGARTE